MKYFLILLITTITTVVSYSQTIIEGYVYDENAVPLENISVLLLPVNSSTIIGYDITNAAGHFSISLNSTNVDSIDVKARSLNYTENVVRT